MKHYNQGFALNQKIIEGVDILADNVATTLGPRGRNVALYHKEQNLPVITKDGVTQQFRDDDNILLTKSGLTTPQEPARSPDVPPQDDGAILAALGRIESALSRRQTIDLRGGQAFVERNMKNAQDGQVRMGVA